MYMDKVTSDRKITREPLQRVTSETAQRWPAPVPSLHRSATDSQISLGSSDGRRPSLAGLKTNGSEQTLDKKRLSALDRLRIRQREVDFDVMSQASTSKKGKQAAIEASLKDAIGALKRPNRALVSAEVADAVAQRALMAKGRAKGKSPSGGLYLRSADRRSITNADHEQGALKDTCRSDTVTQADIRHYGNRIHTTARATGRGKRTGFGHELECSIRAVLEQSTRLAKGGVRHVSYYRSGLGYYRYAVARRREIPQACFATKSDSIQ